MGGVANYTTIWSGATRGFSCGLIFSGEGFLLDGPRELGMFIIYMCDLGLFATS